MVGSVEETPAPGQRAREAARNPGPKTRVPGARSTKGRSRSRSRSRSRPRGRRRIDVQTDDRSTQDAPLDNGGAQQQNGNTQPEPSGVAEPADPAPVAQATGGGWGVEQPDADDAPSAPGGGWGYTHG